MRTKRPSGAVAEPQAFSRREFMKLGLSAAAGLLVANQAGAAWLEPGARGSRLARPAGEKAIYLHNTHTGETLKTVFWVNGRYLPESMREINHILRDHRTNETLQMDPALIHLVHDLGRQVDFARPVEIISGYRCPLTNARLHEEGHGVAQNSFHMKGQAMDIRMPGRSLAYLREAALDMRRGGVGYYPRSEFVHVDTGPVRHWMGA